MLPASLWAVQLVGQYLRPDGDPHRGYIMLTPDPVAVTATIDGTPVTITLQAARIDIDEDGYVASELLNPNDPTIKPGPATGERWGYTVVETFQMGPVIQWYLEFPAGMGDGDFLDLAKVERRDEKILRPLDWFPHHLIDTPVQASRISPRNGPLLREFPTSAS